MKVYNVAPQVTNVQRQGNAKNVQFKGNLATSFKDIFQLERAGNMSRKLFTLNAFAFLLGGRLLKSRDKDEIRETATRDVPTIILAVFGVPFVENVIAKSLHKSKKGFAICNSKERKDNDGKVIKDANGKPKLSYSTGSFDNLRDWYVYDEKLSSGFKGFAERLVDKGANLKKVFSKVEVDSSLAERISKLSDDNATFIKELFEEAKNADLKDAFMAAFKNNKNKALEAAKWIKTIPILAGFGITLGAIGIMIPKFNIALTEMINKKKVMDAKAVEPAKTEA